MVKLRVGLIVDDSDQSYLNYDLYRKSLDSKKYSIEYLIVQKTFHTEAKPFLKRNIDYLKRRGLRKLIRRSIFSLIDRLESKTFVKNRKLKDVFIIYNLSDFHIPKIYVTPVVSPSGLVYRYTSEDIQSIKNLDLDVLIRGGRGILRGDILDICRLGIISFHHANNDVNRGGPPGFWEVFNREPSTGFVVQRLLSELDGGDVIFKGNIATSFSYKVNFCKLYIKSNIFLHQTLEKLSTRPDKVNVYPKVPYSYPLYSTPTSRQILLYVLKTFLYNTRKEISKLLGKSFRWGVAYQFTEDWKNAVLWRCVVIKNPPYRFLADPFVVTKNEKTVIFVEDYDYRTSRGKISAYEVNPIGYKELGTALEESFHLSFPYLLRVEDELYMVPETHESNDIRLYKCLEFPLKWKLEKILMEGISTADTSVFEFDGKWWLFTNKDSSEFGDHNSELHIYYSDSFNSSNWIPHSENPVIFDSICARNGGLIVSDDGVYRVFQRQGFDMYGESMGISKIVELTPLSYREETLFDIPPKFMKNIRGTHTYSFDSGVLCVDFVKYESYRK